MSNFRRVNAIDLTTDRAVINEVIAREYKGLPECTESKAGIVKVDGITIAINSNGQITAKTENYEELFKHTQNQQIHLNPEDTDNLNALRTHLKSVSSHFINGEKELWLDDLERFGVHCDKKHLTDKEVETISNHVKDKDIHFDNKNQKKMVVDLLEEAMKISQGIPDRILVTDSKGRVSVSTISSQILGCISDINTGTFSYFDDRYASLNHTHSEISSIGSHISNSDIHFKENEKKEMYREIEDLKDKLDKEKEIYVTFDDIENKASVEHNHDTETIFHKNEPLYDIINQLVNDVESLKTR